MGNREKSYNKKILLISHNFSPEPTGIGKYNGEMMEWLTKHGYDCTVITTFPYYPHWKVQHPYKNRWYKKEVMTFPGSDASMKIYRCPSYVPAAPTGKKRIMQDFSFWSSMFWRVMKSVIFNEKFDLIITVAPPFHLAYLGLMLRKFTGGFLLYHIQDLQIDAAQDLNMLSNKRLLDRIYKMERDIIEKADYVSSISEGMIAKIQTKVKKHVFLFPNWADTDHFFPIKDRNCLKEKWGYRVSDTICMYAGAIGEKQGLENILSAAEDLLNQDNIKFIICGSGPYKEKLVQLAAEKQLLNVQFLPVQDLEVFNEFLNMADYHLILQKANAGDLVMPSKLTTILAVGGVCIVTSSPSTSLYNLVSKYNVGYITEPDDHQLLSKLILNIKSDDSYETKKENSRKYAMKYLNLDNIMQEFLGHVFN